MLLRIVAAITLASAFTGLLAFFSGARRKSQETIPSNLAEKKRKRRHQGSLLFWLSTSAFVFLITGYGTPVEILLGLAICLALAYPLTIIKGGLRLVSGDNIKESVGMARDAETGELLGPVVGQHKEASSDRIISYKIRIKNGVIIERPVQAIVIDLE